MKLIIYPLTLLLVLGGSCIQGQKSTSPSGQAFDSISNDSLLSLVEYQTFRYFWDGAEPKSGMARERYHADDNYPQNDKHIVTVGGAGFGVMIIVAGIERGYITRLQGYERIKQIVDFLEKADRFHGAWPHWLNGETGKVKPFSEKDDGADLVETAYMIQGLLTARQYFSDGSSNEKELASRIHGLWREVEWDWFTHGGEKVLYWHWSPRYGWEMNFPVEGYNECLIMYILAASSPTHPIDAEAYHKGWARNGKIKISHNIYGYSLNLKHNGAELYGGPLFWSHYSYLGLDPRGLKDAYADYWEHNKNHTLINRQWCIENPMNYKGYGEQCWGLTSSYSISGYAGHAPGRDRDKGVISPTAALSSIPYTPEYSLDAMKNFYYQLGPRLFGEYGFYDAFSEQHNWFPEWYLAIDQGPVVVMIENFRSGLLWDLFMSCPEISQGLKKLGFTVDQQKKDKIIQDIQHQYNFLFR